MLWTVTNAETLSVVIFTLVVGGSCVVVTVDISVAVLFSSALEVSDADSVVFGVVCATAVGAAVEETSVVFDSSGVAATVK